MGKSGLTIPNLEGQYKKSAQHPRVFTTQNDLADFVSRINKPGSFSSQAIGTLGTVPSISLLLPWTKYFDRAIYGINDRPIESYPNPGPSSLTSKTSFQTNTVAPGEVEDRYRNANQGIALTINNMSGNL